MFAIRDNQILKIDEVIKPSEKGGGTWVVLNGMKKSKLISNSKIFNTEEEAKASLNKKIEAKSGKNAKFEEEQEQINSTMNDIFTSFGVTVKCLGRPTTLEEAKELYHRIKNDKSIRNTEIC